MLHVHPAYITRSTDIQYIRLIWINKPTNVPKNCLIKNDGESHDAVGHIGNTQALAINE